MSKSNNPLEQLIEKDPSDHSAIADECLKSQLPAAEVFELSKSLYQDESQRVDFITTYFTLFALHNFKKTIQIGEAGATEELRDFKKLITSQKAVLKPLAIEFIRSIKSSDLALGLIETVDSKLNLSTKEILDLCKGRIKSEFKSLATALDKPLTQSLSEPMREIFLTSNNITDDEAQGIKLVDLFSCYELTGKTLSFLGMIEKEPWQDISKAFGKSFLNQKLYVSGKENGLLLYSDRKPATIPMSDLCDHFKEKILPILPSMTEANADKIIEKDPVHFILYTFFAEHIASKILHDSEEFYPNVSSMGLARVVNNEDIRKTFLDTNAFVKALYQFIKEQDEIPEMIIRSYLVQNGKDEKEIKGIIEENPKVNAATAALFILLPLKDKIPNLQTILEDCIGVNRGTLGGAFEAKPSGTTSSPTTTGKLIRAAATVRFSD